MDVTESRTTLDRMLTRHVELEQRIRDLAGELTAAREEVDRLSKKDSAGGPDDLAVTGSSAT